MCDGKSDHAQLLSTGLIVVDVMSFVNFCHNNVAVSTLSNAVMPVKDHQ